jgi:hypothetical protein
MNMARQQPTSELTLQAEVGHQVTAGLRHRAKLPFGVDIERDQPRHRTRYRRLRQAEYRSCATSLLRQRHR